LDGEDTKTGACYKAKLCRALLEDGRQ